MAANLQFSDDEDIKDIRRAIQGLTSTSRTRKPTRNAKFMPGAYKTFFEGSNSDEDMIHFPIYVGNHQNQHDQCPRSEPQLRQKNAASDHSRRRYREWFIGQGVGREEQENMPRISGCFGTLYMFDEPPEAEMTIGEFQVWGERTHDYTLDRRVRLFRSSFDYKNFSPERVQEYLGQEGYELADSSTWYEVKITFIGDRAKHSCNIILNERGEFVEFCYPPVKWVIFNYKRADRNLRDIRLTLDTPRRTDDESDPGVKLFKDKVILDVGENDVYLVDPDVRRQCQYVNKITREIYNKPEGEGAGGMNPRIILQKYTEFKNPDTNGRFRDSENKGEDVLVQPSSWQYEDFPDDFLRFCCELERALEDHQ